MKMNSGGEPKTHLINRSVIAIQSIEVDNYCVAEALAKIEAQAQDPLLHNGPVRSGARERESYLCCTVLLYCFCCEAGNGSQVISTATTGFHTCLVFKEAAEK
ncbi:hypothetical protein LK542_01995 [Massilia sp. IC2-477]|uniref:hypothetical protein n=1 Tax=Massilia sp. IC2-477 TaxID=2887198 RepID=UPI001D1183A3|nr:hypothetical protein [Massilia sp. IC2-477]MCC2954381.1 hypothetical protein [Massilia sp. IC2-477]